MSKKSPSAHSKHSNQVRIIGGIHRGRKLNFTAAAGLRPTPDSVREKLFNWLGQDLTGQNVLDLFAGSGALGLEAASRHARRVVLCENNRQTAQTLQQHLKTLNLHNAAVINQDALLWLQQSDECFDLVLLDPPFVWQDWQKLFALLPKRLNAGAFIYLEAGSLPELPCWLSIYREGKSGMVRHLLLQYQRLQEND